MGQFSNTATFHATCRRTLFSPTHFEEDMYVATRLDTSNIVNAFKTGLFIHGAFTKLHYYYYYHYYYYLLLHTEYAKCQRGHHIGKVTQRLLDTDLSQSGQIKNYLEGYIPLEASD